LKEVDKKKTNKKHPGKCGHNKPVLERCFIVHRAFAACFIYLLIIYCIVMTYDFVLTKGFILLDNSV